MSSKRTVCWFSAGAASAVATKIAVEEFGQTGPLSVYNIYLATEHIDNDRFLEESSKWFARPIEQLQDKKYHANPFEVFEKQRFLISAKGAPCTRILKREVREQHQRANDRHVFGFTYDEQDRYDRFIDANNVDCDAPLIRHKLTKNDCFALLSKAGIALPEMYRLGYKNNNRIGCVKGGAGYWNKIRRDFPDTFERMAQTEEKIGRTVIRVVTGYEMRNGKKRAIKAPLPLRQLPPDMGRYEDESDIECGAACQMAAENFADACEDL